jgi:malate synthase
MVLLKRQLLSPKYIQHSARVLFLLAQATAEEREQILAAIFDVSRQEIVKRLQAGAMKPAALAVHDYVYDIFPVS